MNPDVPDRLHRLDRRTRAARVGLAHEAAISERLRGSKTVSPLQRIIVECLAAALLQLEMFDGKELRGAEAGAAVTAVQTGLRALGLAERPAGPSPPIDRGVPEHNFATR